MTRTPLASLDERSPPPPPLGSRAGDGGSVPAQGVGTAGAAGGGE